MIYLKSILVGIAAFAVSVIVFSMIGMTVMWRFPEIALRIFPGTYHELGWGGFFTMDFPFWQTLVVGVFAFGIAVRWMLRKTRARAS